MLKMNLNLKKVTGLLILSVFFRFSFAGEILVNSPDGKLTAKILSDSVIRFSLDYNGTGILNNSIIAVQIDQGPALGKDMEVIDNQMSSFDETWKPVLGRYASIRNNYNQAEVRLKEKRSPGRELTLFFRVFNDGFAFRYLIPESYQHYIPNYEKRDYLVLNDELTTFRFTGNYTVWAADYGSYASHQESEFQRNTICGLSVNSIIGVPFLVRIRSNLYVAITEADLTDFAGMYLGKTNGDTDPSLVTKLSPRVNGSGKVYLKPGSKSPWRVVMVGNAPGRLIESEIINNLNEPCEIKDQSWIKPGISAWDHWWSGEVKMDTETIKKYIGLAADMGWPYMIIDWNWYGPPFLSDGGFRANPDVDITQYVSSVNMPEVINYAKSRNVGLVLWIEWEHVKKQMEEAFSLYEKWGIKGVKIDFMARDDQEMVNWYHEVIKSAAVHKLVVDFHGAYKPTGEQRTWPNLITREGVMGNEYNKWSVRVTPEHNCTLPFTRMLAGPMDFTPGGFLNRSPEKFECGSPANVMTTRCQQLAMFVVFDSPFMVACDHPDHYYNQPGIEFLKKVPTTWDNTMVLKGEVGEYIVMARKKGNNWYLGAMTNSDQRNTIINADFIDPGKYKLIYFADGPKANQDAQDLRTGEIMLKKGDQIEIKMAKGGGYAAYIIPLN
jgi:alpha-glucosidase